MQKLRLKHNLMHLSCLTYTIICRDTYYALQVTWKNFVNNKEREHQFLKSYLVGDIQVF